MSKKTMAILTRTHPDSMVNGKWNYKTESFEVRVMASAEKYCMVRRKGCMPFVCEQKDLQILETK